MSTPDSRLLTRCGVALIPLLLISGACGFRGPLYLPDEAPEEPVAQQAAAPGETAPKDEEADKDRERE